MGREDLEEYISKHMDSNDPESITVESITVDSVSSTNDDVCCQWCGSVVDTDTSHTVQRTPEHGGEMKEAMFCDPDCLYEFWNDLHSG